MNVSPFQVMTRPPALFLLFAVVALLSCFGQARTPAQGRFESLELVDKSGKTYARLRQSGSGGMLEMFDSQGGKRVELGIDQGTHGTSLVLRDGGARMHVFLDAEEDGSGSSLQLSGNSTRPNITLDASAAPLLTLYEKPGKPQIQVGVKDQGLRIYYSDPKTKKSETFPKIAGGDHR